MSPRSTIGLVLVLVAALSGWACSAILPPRPTPTPADCWIAMRGVFRLTAADEGEPSAEEQEEARQVVESLVASIGFADFVVRTNSGTIEIYLPQSADPEVIRAALRPAGGFLFVPIPEGRSVEPGDALPPGLPPLFGREGVDTASPGFTQAGQDAIDLTLTDDAGKRLDDWAAANVGAQLAIVGGGRVLVAPVIQARSFGARLQLSGPGLEIRQVLAVLRAPPLPGTLEEVSFGRVGPPAGCPAGR